MHHPLSGVYSCSHPVSFCQMENLNNLVFTKIEKMKEALKYLGVSHNLRSYRYFGAVLEQGKILFC